MIDKIKEALKKAKVSIYQIKEVKSLSAELFFVKHELNTKRMTDKVEYTVKVFNEFEEDDNHYLGEASVTLPAYSIITSAEMVKKFKEAYKNAAFVKNKYYSLPDKEAAGKFRPDTQKNFNGKTVQEVAGDVAMTVFMAEEDHLRGGNSFDTPIEDIIKEGRSFLNSLEVYAIDKTTRIINSNELDVSFKEQITEGEIVVQCKKKEDVELFREFYYKGTENDILSRMVREFLSMAELRSEAIKFKLTDNKPLPVILYGDSVREMLQYYVEKSLASYVYPHYSDYKVGKEVQDADNAPHSFDEINITLNAPAPYDEEGRSIDDKVIIKDGICKVIHGGSRFSEYLGIEPAGVYVKGGLTAEPTAFFSVPAGTHTLSGLKNGRYLEIMGFSDFQVDPITGEFGGEFRLAILHIDDACIPVTGGTINGIVDKSSNTFKFSKEMQKSNGFSGPLALKFDRASVGCKL